MLLLQARSQGGKGGGGRGELVDAWVSPTFVMVLTSALKVTALLLFCIWLNTPLETALGALFLELWSLLSQYQSPLVESPHLHVVIYHIHCLYSKLLCLSSILCSGNLLQMPNVPSPDRLLQCAPFTWAYAAFGKGGWGSNIYKR